MPPFLFEASMTSKRKFLKSSISGNGSDRPRKSRYNAVTHGIFSVGILPRESKAKYIRLVKELAESLQPVGRLEEILVEKLAMQMWRYRRLLQAEAAGIGVHTASVKKEDRSNRVHAICDMLLSGKAWLGEAVLGESSACMQHVLQFLIMLREQIQKEGLDWERDRETLSAIFGTIATEEHVSPPSTAAGEVPEKLPNPWGHVPEKYRELIKTKEADPSADSAGAVQKMLNAIDSAILCAETRLRHYQVQDEQMLTWRTELGLLPERESADRLQRYEGSLERAFERTLAQLERLQRQRLGQPVPPPIKVDLST